MIKITKDPKVRLARKVKSRILSTNRMRIRIVRTNRYLTAIVFDANDRVLFSVCSNSLDHSKKSYKNKSAAIDLAKHVSGVCKDNKWSEFVFDRYFYKYHGVVSVFSDELRKNDILI